MRKNARKPRQVITVTIGGETDTLSGWAKRYGKPYSTVYGRYVESGMPIMEALTLSSEEAQRRGKLKLRKQKQAPKRIDPDKLKLCNQSVCKKCMYSETEGGGSYRAMCMYICVTGKRRPSPAGDCKEFVPLAGKKKPKPLTWGR